MSGKNSSIMPKQRLEVDCRCAPRRAVNLMKKGFEVQARSQRITQVCHDSLTHQVGSFLLISTGSDSSGRPADASHLALGWGMNPEAVKPSGLRPGEEAKARSSSRQR